MNKDELDPTPGRLSKIETEDPSLRYLARTLDEIIEDYVELSKKYSALRAENERLRTLLEQTTVIKREE